MTPDINPTPGECVTLTKERYRELLDYERIAHWALNCITEASLPDMQKKAEELKELSNDAKCKAIQTAFQENMKENEEWGHTRMMAKRIKEEKP